MAAVNPFGPKAFVQTGQVVTVMNAQKTVIQQLVDDVSKTDGKQTVLSDGAAKLTLVPETQQKPAGFRMDFDFGELMSARRSSPTPRDVAKFNYYAHCESTRSAKVTSYCQGSLINAAEYWGAIRCSSITSVECLSRVVESLFSILIDSAIFAKTSLVD